MSSRLTIVFLVFCTFFMEAQTVTKFDNLMDSANKYEFIDWNLSYSYAKMALANKDADFSYKDVISLNTIFDTYYQNRNMLDSAFSINKQSLKLATENKDTMLTAYSLNNMAAIYDLAGNYKAAIEIYKKGLVILEKLKDVKQIANTQYNMAIPYSKSHMSDSARYYTDLAFANYKKINNYSGIASCYDFYATEADKRGSYEEAVKLYKLEIENFELANEPTSMIIPYQNIADTYLKQKDYKNCKKYLDLAMNLSVEMGADADVYSISDTYSRYYEAIGDYRQANFYMKRYYEGKDAMVTNQLKTGLSDQKSQFDRENSEALLTIQKLEAERNLKSKEEIKWGLILSSVFFAIVLILSINRYRAKQKSWVKLNEYKNQLVLQKERIEETQKEITDSIHYAKRIQDSLLAHKNFIDSYVRSSFILFKPKDIVSGDFYWASKKDHYFYLAVCDSTGHGVPGAFISLLNMGFLSEAINEKNISEPNLVFDYVRSRLIDTVSKDGQSDGFDGVLLRINTETKEIVYTAANSAAILVSGTTIAELQKDKMPVGRYERTTPFNLYTLEYSAFDTLYLYTDGFADQFGGPKAKKFKYKALNETLTGLSHLPMNDQQQLLDKHFTEWKGALEQVDDVCVIGIRI